MSFLELFDPLIEMFVNSYLPGVVCPIIQRCAGPNCRDLRMAILMNESLLEAYKKGATDQGLWDYESVKGAARSYPKAKRFVSGEKVMGWLMDKGHYDIIAVIESTPGGQNWLNRQIEDFKTDLFGSEAISIT